MQHSLLSDVLKLCRAYGVKPSRKSGQNFVVEYAFLKRMVDYANLNDKDVVVEVGAGFGILTEMLARKAGKVIAVEKDLRMIKALQDRLKAFSNVEIVHGDVLKVNLPDCNKVCANPPYFISSKLIFKLLEGRPKTIILTLQKEFADRLIAAPGTKEYGRITVMVNYKATVRALEYVPREFFYPRPRVDSALVEIRGLSEPAAKIADEELFTLLVRELFTQRNKLVKKALRLALNNLNIRCKIPPLLTHILNKRVYELTLKDFALITNELLKGV